MWEWLMSLLGQGGETALTSSQAAQLPSWLHASDVQSVMPQGGGFLDSLKQFGGKLNQGIGAANSALQPTSQLLQTLGPFGGIMPKQQPPAAMGTINPSKGQLSPFPQAQPQEAPAQTKDSLMQLIKALLGGGSALGSGIGNS